MKQDEAAIAEKAVEVLLGRIAEGRDDNEVLIHGIYNHIKSKMDKN